MQYLQVHVKLSDKSTVLEHLDGGQHRLVVSEGKVIEHKLIQTNSAKIWKLHSLE